MSNDDAQLLARYAADDSPDAFRQLVERHIDLVYASARRQVVDGHTADDVTQAVFIILARKAKTISKPELLVGWLLRATRYCASNVRLAEARRQKREQEAAEMVARINDDAPEQHDLAPVLDEALGRLKEADRSAVAMRFLQGKSLREVGEAMGTSEFAAGKRVQRAIAKLRDVFARRGINSTADAIEGSLDRHSKPAAPANLHLSVAEAALAALAASAAPTSSLLIAKAAMKSMFAPAKWFAAAAVAACGFVVACGAIAALSTQPAQSKAVAEAPLAPPQSLTKVIAATIPTKPWDGWRMSALPNPPGTKPPTPPEVFERFASADPSQPIFSGRVLGLAPGERAEIGVCYHDGVPWTKLDNFQWEPVAADGSFTIIASQKADKWKALMVRAPQRPWTFLRAMFAPGDSARNIVLRAKAGKMVTVTLADSSDARINSFKAEIFPVYEILLDDGRRSFGAQFGSFAAQNAEMRLALPLGPVALIVTAPGLASCYAVIDSRDADHFHFKLMKESRIDGLVLRNGAPAAGVDVKIVNRAAPIVSAIKRTDKQGHFTAERYTAGDTQFIVNGKMTVVKLLPEATTSVKLEIP